MKEKKVELQVARKHRSVSAFVVATVVVVVAAVVLCLFLLLLLHFYVAVPIGVVLVWLDSLYVSKCYVGRYISLVDFFPHKYHFGDIFCVR